MDFRFLHFSLPLLFFSGAALLALSLSVAAEPASSIPTVDEEPFLAENNAAMTKMMTGMDIKPSGDIDADFVAMMVPHHEGAIDMALAQLRYGRNEQLRRLAQEIIVTQQQEIAAMRLAVGQPLPPSVPSPTQPSAIESTAAQSMAQHSMHAH
jgi:Domain of unknown function (DUF305)